MSTVLDRPHGLGASDAPVACGVSPWKSAWELCLEKMGELEPGPMNEAMRLGLLLEPVVSQLYSEQTGYPLITCPLVPHPKIPWAFCSPDRLRDDGSGHLVELKTSRRFDGWGPAGTDEIPEPYLIQVHHQMECCGRDAADVAVLIAGQEFRIYHVCRNQRLIDAMLEREREFWKRVEERDPPTPDFSAASCQRVLASMYGVDDVEIELGRDEMALAIKYLSAQQNEKFFETLKQEHKARLLYAMRGAARARLPDGVLLTRKEITRREHTVKESTYTQFRVKEPKRDDDASS